MTDWMDTMKTIKTAKYLEIKHNTFNKAILFKHCFFFNLMYRICSKYTVSEQSK